MARRSRASGAAKTTRITRTHTATKITCRAQSIPPFSTENTARQAENHPNCDALWRATDNQQVDIEKQSLQSEASPAEVTTITLQISRARRRSGRQLSSKSVQSRGAGESESRSNCSGRGGSGRRNRGTEAAGSSHHEHGAADYPAGPQIQCVGKG